MPTIIMGHDLSVCSKRKMGIAFPIGSNGGFLLHLVAEQHLINFQLLLS